MYPFLTISTLYWFATNTFTADPHGHLTAFCLTFWHSLNFVSVHSYSHASALCVDEDYTAFNGNVPLVVVLEVWNRISYRYAPYVIQNRHVMPWSLAAWTSGHCHLPKSTVCWCPAAMWNLAQRWFSLHPASTCWGSQRRRTCSTAVTWSEASVAVNHGGVAVVAAAGVRLASINTGVKPSTFQCVCTRVMAGTSSYIVWALLPSLPASLQNCLMCWISCRRTLTD